MRSKGASDEQLEKYRQAKTGSNPKEFDVWIENKPALDVFLSCQTQWRVIAGVGACIYQGLDYAALNSVIDRKVKRKRREQVFDDVRLIEAGALTELNRKRNG